MASSYFCAGEGGVALADEAVELLGRLGPPLAAPRDSALPPPPGAAPPGCAPGSGPRAGPRRRGRGRRSLRRSPSRNPSRASAFSAPRNRSSAFWPLSAFSITRLGAGVAGVFGQRASRLGDGLVVVAAVEGRLGRLHELALAPRTSGGGAAVGGCVIGTVAGAAVTGGAVVSGVPPAIVVEGWPPPPPPACRVDERAGGEQGDAHRAQHHVQDGVALRRRGHRHRRHARRRARRRTRRGALAAIGVDRRRGGAGHGVAEDARGHGAARGRAARLRPRLLQGGRRVAQRRGLLEVHRRVGLVLGDERRAGGSVGDGLRHRAGRRLQLEEALQRVHPGLRSRAPLQELAQVDRELVRGLVALVEGLGQRLLEDRHEVVVVGALGDEVEVRLLVGDLVEDRHEVVGVEGAAAGQELVEHAADAEEVAAAVDLGPLHLLRATCSRRCRRCCRCRSWSRW